MNLLDRLNARMAIYNESIIQPLINPEFEKKPTRNKSALDLWSELP